MQLQIYRVKNLTVGKKRYILYIPRKRYIQRNLFIYHCGDVSGEVPPVLIPNTVVKLTCADNTWLETIREDRLLLHPNKKRTTLMSGSFFALLHNVYLPANRLRFWSGRCRKLLTTLITLLHLLIQSNFRTTNNRHIASQWMLVAALNKNNNRTLYRQPLHFWAGRSRKLLIS